MSHVLLEHERRMEWLIPILDKSMLWGMLLYLVVMFNVNVTALNSIGLYLPLLAWLIKHLLTKGRELSYLKSWVFLMFGSFFVIMLFSATFVASDPVEGLKFYRKTMMEALIPILVIPDVFRSYKYHVYLLYAFLLSSILMTIENTLQYIGEFSAGRNPFNNLNLHRWYSRPFVFLESFMLAGVALSNRYAKFAGIALLSISMVYIVGTGTRGGWISLSVAFLITLGLIYRANIRAWFVGLIRVIIIILSIIYLVPENSAISSKIHQKLESPERMKYLFPLAIDMIMERPITGYGYQQHRWKEVGPDFIKSHKQYQGRSAGLYMNEAHNTYLMVGFFGGIPALFSYLLLLSVASLVLFKGALYYENMILRLISAGAIGSLIGFYVVRGFTDVMYFQPLGVIVGIAYLVYLYGGSEVKDGK